MKNTTKKWLPYAKADIELAKISISQKNKTRWTNLLTLWHCQQAIEKLLKAIMVEKGKEIVKIHDLGRLQELAEVDLTEEELKFILALNNYYLKSRYPDLINKPLPAPSDEITKKLFKQTNDLYLWLLEYLEKL